jgi:hypothetical protein
MTARTRTVKKTTEPTTPTPAKKTTAKRTPAKPRTPRTRKTTTPVLSLVKEQPTVQPQPTVTLVDLRKPLKRRRRNFTGPHTPAQLTEARACLASAMAGLPIPHILWLTQINGHAAARLADGTCTRRHDDTDPGAGGYDWHKATTLGIQKLIPARLSPLNAGLKTAKKATAKTQPMNTAVIAEGLAARAAANTDPKPAKEPPQP